MISIILQYVNRLVMRVFLPLILTSSNLEYGLGAFSAERAIESLYFKKYLHESHTIFLTLDTAKAKGIIHDAVNFENILTMTSFVPEI